MRIRRERLVECLAEVDALIKDYYERTEEAPRGQPPLEMDWQVYANIEKAGNLTIYTARMGNVLVGFAMYLTGYHAQHKGMKFALCNTLAVDPDFRGQGIGTKLVKHAETDFRMSGVGMMIHGFRMVYNTEPLFPKLGFTEIERMYMKVL